MDCIYCGLQISSRRELEGLEICHDCGIGRRIQAAREAVYDLIDAGWGSQSAANSVQSKFNLSDSQTDDVACHCELYREDR